MAVLATFFFGSPKLQLSLPERYILSGKFHPLHRGHLAVAHYVKEKFNKIILFEIPSFTPQRGMIPVGSTTNKLLVDDKMSKIIRQFDILNRDLVITDDITFTAKSRTFGNCTFVVGPEVLAKFCNPVSYFQSIKETKRCIEMFKLNGGKFLVVPRTIDQAEYGFKIPNIIRDVTTIADDFRPIEISSTEIRADLKKIEIDRDKKARIKAIEEGKTE